MQRFDPRFVKLELDVFWAVMGGGNPVALLQQYAGRIPLVHLKDKAKGSTQQRQERQVPPTAFTEVGNGELNFPSILQAASQAGVQHYFVEQDRCPGNPLDSLRQSYNYLQKISQLP